MNGEHKFFIEIDHCREQEDGQVVCGEVYLQKRFSNRIVLVSVSGGGSGIRTHTVAHVAASMALNHTLMGTDPVKIARSVIRTFSPETVADEKNTVGFTVADIHLNGTVRLLECGQPGCFFFRGRERVEARSRTGEIGMPGRSPARVRISEFSAGAQDRIVFVNEGIVRSGEGTKRLPDGWRISGVAAAVARHVGSQSDLSAFHLCRRIMAEARMNDLFKVRNDLSCFSVYFRQPRGILVCSGPPLNEKKDEILADIVRKYPGTKLICGGTTSQIVARELKREVAIDLKRDSGGLPPTSRMEGVDLITEGVLTLNKVRSLLESMTGTEVTATGIHAEVAGLLLSHDVIEFLVGTRINPVHQDPDLPVELELRRNLIKGLAEILESKFMKEVRIRYI